MILVTVGTHDRGFDRLVRAMDHYAATTGERVVIQRGSSSYKPRHAEALRFTDYETMEGLTRAARLVVTHAAAGTIILAIRLGKPLVVVPRRAAKGEAVDDHQYQLAGALAAQGRVRVVEEPSCEALREAIQRAAPVPLNPGSRSVLARALLDQLGAWERELARRSRRGQ
jgi:UDP-N-acetylglucosamine transferase subunit ALG13